MTPEAARKCLDEFERQFSLLPGESPERETLCAMWMRQEPFKKDKDGIVFTTNRAVRCYLPYQNPLAYGIYISTYLYENIRSESASLREVLAEDDSDFVKVFGRGTHHGTLLLSGFEPKVVEGIEVRTLGDFDKTQWRLVIENGFEKERTCLLDRIMNRKGRQGPKPETLEVRARSRERENYLIALSQLREQFYALHSSPKRQEAGFRLQTLLCELMKLEGLSPRSAFRKGHGEETDGTFVLAEEVYLLEAKWEKDGLPRSVLKAFHSKVASQSGVTRGLFVSVNGFSDDAIAPGTYGETPPRFVCMDGFDLTPVLEGTTQIKVVLGAKLRALAEKGRVFVSLKELRSRGFL